MISLARSILWPVSRVLCGLSSIERVTPFSAQASSCMSVFKAFCWFLLIFATCLVSTAGNELRSRNVAPNLQH